MKFTCKSLEDTKKLAQKFAALVSRSGCFTSFYGEIGAGKTAFIKFMLEEIGVTTKVTSPSFVILNEYHGNHLPAYHFDLYRLETEGLKTIQSELVEYSRDGVITLVEWAEFGGDELPFERVSVKVKYGENEERIYEFEGVGKKYEEVLNELARV